jgi:GNAT superfamily N-acetyltransferase
LAAAGVPLSELPPAVTKKLPRYPTVPAIRVGRLAVDRHFQGRGFGSGLLADAATRGLHTDVAAFLLLVEAESAATFYEKLGFLRLESRARSLFLPLATAEKAWVR